MAEAPICKEHGIKKVWKAGQGGLGGHWACPMDEMVPEIQDNPARRAIKSIKDWMNKNPTKK